MNALFNLDAYLWAGAALGVLAVLLWLFSLIRDDVSIVDAFWSLMFLLAAVVYYLVTPTTGPLAGLVLALTAIWAVRLSVYIAWRNHGQPEDHRYQEIRKNNQPGFRIKSLYIVFGLQALLAWVISLPLMVALSGQATPGPLSYIGAALWLIGFIFESLGDWQLSRFKADPDNKGKVLNTGLWRYTRHPNYFGNFTLWWGFYLIALSVGGWWTIVSPLLMSFLLLRVSGVTLLEKDIGERRPSYAQYVKNTNAFFPGPSKS